MTDRLVTDLPEPDSPTSASVSPAQMVRSRSLTAVIVAAARSRKTVLQALDVEDRARAVAMAFSSAEPGGAEDRVDLRGLLAR